jgi:glycosyltransferase involved in cell wall biosynthesis
MMPFSRVILVDDGSSDDSISAARQLQAKAPNLEIVVKENGGQLSAIRAGVEKLDGSEMVFLLDADDALPYSYTHNILTQAGEEHMFLGLKSKFHKASELDNKVPIDVTVFPFCHVAVRENAYSCLVQNCWTGTSTSGISLGAALLKKLVALAPDEDWRIRADDVIILGATYIEGATILQSSATYFYRTHVSNNFWNRKQKLSSLIRREAAIFGIYLKATNKGTISLWRIWDYKSHSHPNSRSPRKLIRLRYFARLVLAWPILSSKV